MSPCLSLSVLRVVCADLFKYTSLLYFSVDSFQFFPLKFTSEHYGWVVLSVFCCPVLFCFVFNCFILCSVDLYYYYLVHFQPLGDVTTTVCLFVITIPIPTISLSQLDGISVPVPVLHNQYSKLQIQS